MISILVPVLSRPQNAASVAASIHAATEVPHTITFLATRGDHDEIEACKATGSVVHLTDPGPCEYARKINAAIAADYGDAEFFFMGADDLRFHVGWDHAAIAAFESSGRPVVGTNDLGNPTVIAGKHSTHSLVHRSYLERGSADGPELLHSGYEHNFVDTEFVETAQARDCFVFAADSIVEHLHPFWRKGSDDAVYEKGREGYHRDRRTYLSRRPLWRNL